MNIPIRGFPILVVIWIPFVCLALFTQGCKQKRLSYEQTLVGWYKAQNAYVHKSRGEISKNASLVTERLTPIQYLAERVEFYCNETLHRRLTDHYTEWFGKKWEEDLQLHPHTREYSYFRVIGKSPETLEISYVFIPEIGEGEGPAQLISLDEKIKQGRGSLELVICKEQALQQAIFNEWKTDGLRFEFKVISKTTLSKGEKH